MGASVGASMMVARRRLAYSATLFAAMLILGGWPREGEARAFSQIYCPLANAGLSRFEFGSGGRVRLQPIESPSRRPGDNVDADAVATLSVEGFEGELPLGISLRRDVYLPWLILVALLAGAPISTITRLAAPLIAAPIVWATSVGAYALLAMWTFATQLRGVYFQSAMGRRLTDFAYGALLAPPGNRFIGPLGLGLLLIVLDRRRMARLASDTLRRR
jgi:hypothetical protein